MSWSPKLEKAPTAKEEPWLTNHRIMDEWVAYNKGRVAKNTQENLLMGVGVFLRTFDTLVTELEASDIENFTDNIALKCSKLMMSNPPSCLLRFPIKNCPLLNDAAAETCTGYVPLLPSGVKAYLDVLNNFYNWLQRLGRARKNPVYDVRRRYLRTHKNWFAERRRKPARRTLTVSEVRDLVLTSPIQHGVAYALLAKCFLRPHEVFLLEWGAEMMNLEEGWAEFVVDPEYGGKRIGCPRIILDPELRQLLREYQIWWDAHVKRDAEGNPLTQRVIITQFGMPIAPKNFLGNFNAALKKNARRLGMMTGDQSEPKKNRVTGHIFRRFATTYAMNRDIPGETKLLLRGDDLAGETIRYDDYYPRLPKLYREYAPILGLYD